jgi:tRNA-binding protein
MRAGKIVEVKDFKEAKKTAYQLRIDFGNKIGVKKSSAQLTAPIPGKSCWADRLLP